MLHEEIFRYNAILPAYITGSSLPSPKNMTMNREKNRMEFTTNITPTLEEFIFALEANEKDYHYDRINEIIKTDTISENDHVFGNIEVDFYYIKDGIKKLSDAIINIPLAIDQYYKNYNFTSQNNSIDLNNELKELMELKKELESDPLYKKTLDFLSYKYDYMNESQHVHRINMTDYKNNKTDKNDNNLSLSGNPLLKPFKDRFEDMLVKFPEFSDEHNQIANINFLYGYTNKAENIVNSMFSKLRNAGLTFSHADIFCDKLNTDNKEKSITGFIVTKVYDDIVPHRVESVSGKYKEILKFRDSSLLLKTSNNEYINIKTRKQIKDLRRELVVEIIRDEFKKYPQTTKVLMKISEGQSELAFSGFKHVMKTYKDNMDILKLYNVDILKTYQSLDKTLVDYKLMEQLDDILNKKVKEHKVKQYANSIGSNKYDHLYDDKSYKIIENIYDLKLERNIFQSNIGKKMAAFKTSNDFNEALELFYKSFNDFSYESTINKADNKGIQVLVENDDFIICKIKNFEESKTMGSSSWCISRDASYFNSYTRDGKEQYFIFDFLKEATDPMSMIGVTLDHGAYCTAHMKDDEGLEESDSELEEFIRYINDAEIALENKVVNKNTLRI